jgi:HK97 family phage portal protein
MPMMRHDNESYMRAMGSVGTLFAIVSRLADSTAEVEWRLWRKAPSGKDEDRKPVLRHAALDLLTTPNPFFQRRLFVEATQQHIDLTGEGWWVIWRDPRSPLPLELWPVRPDRMEPVPHRDRFISGYVYHGPDGEKVPLAVDDVISIKMPNPLDPYRGLGPVQAIMTDLDSARYGSEWNRNFFLNGAEPGGIVEVDERLSDDEFNEMAERWREQHQGVANAHRVAILERGKWVERKFSMRDMQFTQLREVSRETIREAFGFPKGMLGSVDDVNRANAEAGEIMFARWLVQPRCERLKTVLNYQLLPLFGSTAQGLEFDYVTPVPQSREDVDRERDSKAAAAATLVSAGYDPDDVTDAMGLPRMRHNPTPPPAEPAMEPAPVA